VRHRRACARTTISLGQGRLSSARQIPASTSDVFPLLLRWPFSFTGLARSDSPQIEAWKWRDPRSNIDFFNIDFFKRFHPTLTIGK
jgi:hypothetical protein